MHFLRKNPLFLLVCLLIAGCGNEVKFDGPPNDLTIPCGSCDVDIVPDVPHSSYFFVKRAADILFVIDNSGSMADEQTQLSNGFPSFVSALNFNSAGTLDWRVAITTTDVANVGPGKKGQLLEYNGLPGVYYLDSSIPEAAANNAFKNTVLVGTTSSADERGIAAARMAMTLEYSNTTKNFVRADIPISVIVLSDEDEKSDGTNLEDIDKPEKFVSGIHAIDNKSTHPKTITFHSIVTSTQACLNGSGGYMGNTYMQLSNLTNGIIGDICAINKSYQDQLAFLAASIANEARTYTLPCPKVNPHSASAWMQKENGAMAKIKSEFISPNKIKLEDAPPVGSIVKTRFTCIK